MITELVHVHAAGEVQIPMELMKKAKDYIQNAKADNTIKSYRNDWYHFMGWCESQGLSHLPASPETVALYLTNMADQFKTSTLQRRISAISQAHQAAGHESPTRTNIVRSVWAGIRRVHGTAQKGKAPALADELKMMLDTLPDNLLGLRDRAMLLVGFMGAFRRSEIVAINVEDVEFNRDGLVIMQHRSKTDQEGQGRKVGIPFGSTADNCSIRSLQTWIESAGITSGPLFRSVNRHGQVQADRLNDKTVARVVKRCAEAAGLDPAKYSGHSLRAGLATSAHLAGKSERAIMKQTGHKSVNMVRKYIREADLFKDNAASGLL